QYEVQHRHTFTIWNRLRVVHCTGNTNPPLEVRTARIGNNDGHLRAAYIIGQLFDDVVRQLFGGEIGCCDVANQWHGYLAVGTHRHRHRQLRIAPDIDVQCIADPDAIFLEHAAIFTLRWRTVFVT